LGALLEKLISSYFLETFWRIIIGFWRMPSAEGEEALYAEAPRTSKIF